MSIAFIILLIALILFVLAAFGINSPVNLIALGLALITIYFMLSNGIK